MASKIFHFVNHTKLPEGRVLNQLWNNMVLDNETFFFCSVLWQPAAEQGAEFSAPCCSSWWVDRHGDALHWLKLKIAGCRNFRSHFRFWTSMKMGTSNQWGRKWWIPRWWCVFSASHQLIASAMCLWQSKPWRKWCSEPLLSWRFSWCPILSQTQMLGSEKVSAMDLQSILRKCSQSIVLDMTFFFRSVLRQPAAEQGAEFSAPCCSSWWVDRHGDALHWLKLKIAGCRNFRSHFRFWTSMKMGTSNQWGRKWWIPRWWCVFSASHQLIASAMCLWQSKPWRKWCSEPLLSWRFSWCPILSQTQMLGSEKVSAMDLQSILRKCSQSTVLDMTFFFSSVLGQVVDGMGPNAGHGFFVHFGEDMSDINILPATLCGFKTECPKNEV